MKKSPRSLGWMEDLALASRLSGFVPTDPEERAFLLAYIGDDD